MMWRRECVVAKIGTCGMVDRSLKLLLLHQVASVVFIFILCIHPSCLTNTIPPSPNFNSMSTPEEREIMKAKVIANMEQARAMFNPITKAEEEERRAAEEAERKQVEEEAERKRVEEEKHQREGRRRNAYVSWWNSNGGRQSQSRGRRTEQRLRGKQRRPRR